MWDQIKFLSLLFPCHNEGHFYVGWDVTLVSLCCHYDTRSLFMYQFRAPRMHNLLFELTILILPISDTFLLSFCLILETRQLATNILTTIVCCGILVSLLNSDRCTIY